MVKLKEDASVTLNSEPAGTRQNLVPLIQRLSVIFDERLKNKVLEENSDRVVKAVGIEVPEAATFGEFMDVAMAVEQAGADPIVITQPSRLPHLPIGR